jgi:two-component system response regulator
MSLPRCKVILLVEDNQDDETLTLRALKKNNIPNKVVVARDGVEALEYLFSANNLPELVLLDLNLPKLDGLAVLRRLRERAETRRLPVVILSSSKEDSDLLASYDSGANSFVQKRVDFSEFTEAVKQLGSYWLVLNEPPPDRTP